MAFPPDYTFLIQLVSFFALLYVLNNILFQPFAAVLAEREARTEGDQGKADEALASVEEMRVRVERASAEARAAASAEYETIRRGTKEQEAAILATAQADAAAKLAEMRAGIEQAREQASGELKAEARAMADEMVKAVLSQGGRA